MGHGVFKEGEFIFVQLHLLWDAQRDGHGNGNCTERRGLKECRAAEAGGIIGVNILNRVIFATYSVWLVDVELRMGGVR